MADTNTTTSVLDNLMQSWFSRKMLVRLVPKTPLIEFAQRDELPLNNGKTATFNGWTNLGPASSTLAEGTANSLPALSSRKVTGTIAGYGRGFKLTDLVQLTAIFDAISGAWDVLSDSASRTVERMCLMGIFKANIARNQSTTGILSAYMSSLVSAFCAVTGTISTSDTQFQFPVIFAQPSGSRLSVVSKTAPSVSAQLSVYSIRKVVTTLRGRNARPFADGYFVGYSHPNALHALMRDQTWKDYPKTLQLLEEVSERFRSPVGATQ